MSYPQPPPVDILWSAIRCLGCGRRLYDDNGDPVEGTIWQRLTGC